MLKIYEIPYTLHQAMREWVAQDECRFVGHSKEKSEHTAWIVAPSKELALAKLDESYMTKDKEYKFKMGEMKVHNLHSLIIDMGHLVHH